MKKILLSILILASFFGNTQTVNVFSDTTMVIPSNLVLTSITTGSVSSYQWSKVSGASITFGTPTASQTTVTGLASGTYVFRLTINGTISDDKAVTVKTCQQGRPIHVGVQGDGGALFDGAGTVFAGDTLFIDSTTAATRTYCYFTNLVGIPFQFDNPTSPNRTVPATIGGQPNGCPIYIMNYGYVDMGSGFDISSDRYIWITGKGANNTDTNGLHVHGFFPEVDYTNGGMVAFHIHDYSKNVIVDHFNIHKPKYGFQIKNDEVCDTMLNTSTSTTGMFPNWVIDSVEIAFGVHSFSESQFIYAGTTNPYNNITHARPVSCSGTNQYPNPSRLGNQWYHHLRVDSTGRGGVQLSGAIIGMSRINNNIIKNTGMQHDDTQGGGITLGGDTRAIVDSNWIRRSLTWNIIDYGIYMDAHDNYCDSSGWTATVGGSTYNLVWGAPMIIRNSLSIPLDSAKFWVTRNSFNHSSISIASPPDDYVVGMQESGGNEGQFAYDNRTFGNTYNGSAIDPSTSPAHPSGIHVSNLAAPINPKVNAGWDYRITKAAFNLNGGASALNGNSILTYSWSQVSGANSATFSSTSNSYTSVSNLIDGNYVFRLTGIDNTGKAAYDDMRLQVSGVGSGGGNISPSSNAGADQNITSPTSQALLNGSGSDVDGTIASYLWTQVSGASATITSPSTASTLITGLSAGVYVFRLTVTDNLGATTSDDIIITVSSPTYSRTYTNTIHYKILNN